MKIALAMLLVLAGGTGDVGAASGVPPSHHVTGEDQHEGRSKQRESGKEDASGGIICRAKDGRNYLLVRANALENNFRLYSMVNGRRRTLASARVTEPKLGQWHRIRVVSKGPKIQAYLDDSLPLDHEYKAFPGGWVGLWTKADSVTEFADLEVTGTPAR